MSKSLCRLFDSIALTPDPTASGWTCGSAPAPTSPPTPAPAPTPSPPPTPGANWVVIAVGSKTYSNYRHQADACHAYQIVRKNGIHPDNIIVMMEDDVASNSANPYPGKMFNKPTARGVPGYDVYAGCKVDYRGR